MVKIMKMGTSHVGAASFPPLTSGEITEPAAFPLNERELAIPKNEPRRSKSPFPSFPRTSHDADGNHVSRALMGLTVCSQSLWGSPAGHHCCPSSLGTIPAAFCDREFTQEAA